MKTVSFKLYRFEELDKKVRDIAKNELLSFTKNRTEQLEDKAVHEVREAIYAHLYNVGLIDSDVPSFSRNRREISDTFKVEYQGPDESALVIETEEFCLGHFIGQQTREVQRKFKTLTKAYDDWDVKIYVSIWAYLNGAKPHVEVVPLNLFTRPLVPLIRQAVGQVTKDTWPQVKTILNKISEEEQLLNTQDHWFLATGAIWTSELIPGIFYEYSEESTQEVPARAEKKRVARK